MDIPFYHRWYLNNPKEIPLTKDSIKGLLGTPVEALKTGVNMDLFYALNDPKNKNSRKLLESFV